MNTNGSGFETVIEFKQEQIEDKERRTHEPYIGYFAPNGELIDYNIMFGGNYHDSWQNPVSWTFLSFISYIIKDTSIEVFKDLGSNIYEKGKYPGIDEWVIRGYGIWYDLNEADIETFVKSIDYAIINLKNKGYFNNYDKFKYKLLLFFKDAYSNKRFFDAIGRKIYVENKNAIDAIKTKRCNWELSYEEKEEFYRDYLKKELMQYFKDISVQYLGYDSLEQFTPTNQDIKIPKWYEEYNFDFLGNPRVITTSYPNVYERYYNYLLMDWRVDRLPRYVFNETTRCFEIDKFLSNYESEKEQILENEIKSIKKLVPIKDRYKYFR